MAKPKVIIFDHGSARCPSVLWLCSHAAAYVIGHALVIDGGQTL